MGNILIRVTGEAKDIIEVISGHRRMEAALSLGQRVEGFDPATSCRYEILMKDGKLIANEIVTH